MTNHKFTEDTAHRLLHEHGLTQERWVFNWDNAKRRGGACHYSARKITMSRHLVPLWERDEIVQTLLHEIAHALVGPEHGHGPVWWSKYRSIGGTRTKSTHSNPVVTGRYKVICPNHGLLCHRHRKPNRTMICPKCRSVVLYVDSQMKVL